MGKIGEWFKDTFIGSEEGEEINEIEETSADEYENKEPERRRHDSRDPRGNIVSINQTVQLEVVLERPDSFDQAGEIADHINNKCAVVLNLEATNKDVARRILDFLAGVSYANSGNMQRVANSTYMITPRGVGLSGEQLGELETNGIPLR